MDDRKIEKKIEWALTAMFVGAVMLLTLPTVVAIFYPLSKSLYTTMNVAGIIIATVRIIISVGPAIATVAVKGESTQFKKSLDKQAKLLFGLTIFIQFLNLAFIHFD